MRRVLLIVVLALGIPALLAFGLGASEPSGGYKVRAIFDNIGSVVEGEDVKVAGAKVGVIEKLDVTADKKAAVTMAIDDNRFAPFKSDARCSIRPQSLIGEKFVECEPGTRSGQALGKIRSGEGEGVDLLPLERTSSPVDLDLVNDIMRLPYRQRFAIILNEFGTGLAGRGRDLNEVIHRSNPALRDTDKVLAILARQNDVLARLATESDQALAPLAREKERVASFVTEANRTAEATAERRDDIRASIRRLPAFLGELRPLMADLEGLADQATPVVDDLGQAAPDVSRLIRQLGPFSQAARPSIRTLGRATVTGRPALLRARPLVQDLRRFASDGRPVSTNLDRLTASLDKTGGIERIMDYLFFQMTAINGFDSLGHYLRAGLIVNLCSTYSIQPVAGCNANFTNTGGIAKASGKKDLEPRLAEIKKADKGDEAKPDSTSGSVAPQGSVLGGLLGADPPGAAEKRKEHMERLRRRANGTSPALKGSDEPMLDYLLGGDE